MNVTIRQLRAALAVASHSSFTRAAEELHLTQPACSGLVRELEEGLGLRLFDRTTRRVTPTEAGAEFLAAASRMLGALSDAIDGVRDLAERRHGRLTIAGPPLLAATLLPPVVRRFRDAFPGILVTLHDLPTDEIAARVLSGEADCGVGTFDVEEPSLVSNLLASDTLQILYPAADTLAAKHAIAWSDMRGRDLVALTRTSGVRALTDRALAAAGIETKPLFEVTQMATAVALVGAGLGVAVLPTYALRYAAMFDVASRPLIRPTVRRDISLIHLRDRALSPATQSFADMLRSHLATGAPAPRRRDLRSPPAH